MHSSLSRFALIVTLTFPTYALGGETLCKPKEKVYFSCTLNGAGKLISLCGNSLEPEEHFWLQYRFGTTDKIELTYPHRRKLFRESEFKISRSRKANGFDEEVNFDNGGWRYTVFYWPMPEDSFWSGVRVARDRNDLNATPLKCYGGIELKHFSAFSELVSRYENEKQ